MAKRTAEYDLNRDNWDEDLPKEDSGTWKIASEEERKARPIIRAKRSLPGSAASSPVPASPFSAWSFGGASASPFSGIGNTSSSSFTKSEFNTTPTSKTPELAPTKTNEVSSSPAVSVQASPQKEPVNTESKLETPSNGFSSVITNQTQPTDDDPKPQISPERRQTLQDRRLQLQKAKARIEQELQEIEQELGPLGGGMSNPTNVNFNTS